jgi:hypothetical protein
MAGRKLPGAALKTALWTRLKLALYPTPVQIGGLPDQARPCVVIGPAFWPDDSTGSTHGFDGQVQVHGWTSPAGGVGPCEALMESILSALTDAELAALTVAGWNLILLELESSEPITDPSGDQHGVMIFRAVLDQIN